MKHIFPLLAFFFISYISFAQYENVDLSKYKLPDIKRHQLNIGFDLSNNYQNSGLENDNELVESNFAQNLDLTYQYYQNSRKLQRSYFALFSSDLSFYKEKEEGDLVRKERDISSDLYFHLDNSFYLKEDKLFLHVKPTFGINYSKQKDRYKEQNVDSFWNEMDKNFSFNPRLNLGVGFGRVESVGDLRHAIYILEAFDKNGLSNGIVSEADVLKIAQKATELKNKRFFDSRLRRIYEIKSLDSLFQSLDIVNATDAVYFTVLNDLWLYGNEQRNSGNRIQVDLLGGWDYTKYFHGGYIDDSSIDDNKNHHTDYGVELSFETYKPIGLKWQRDFSVLCSVIHSTKPNIDDPSDWMLDLLTSHNEYRVSLNYGYKWYMNTRTSASFGCKANYFQLDYIKNHDIYVNDLERYGFDFYGGVNYYFSPRLRLKYSLNFNLAFFDEKYRDYENRLNFISVH